MNLMPATLTLMLVQQLFGRPGFQHNPAFETEANHYFASHCTCASKLFGSDGPRSPYLLRNFAHTNERQSFDRLLATRMGVMAATSLLAGKSGEMVALRGSELELYPLADAVKQLKPLDMSLLQISEVMDSTPVTPDPVVTALPPWQGTAKNLC